jgi:hypothetical protein
LRLVFEDQPVFRHAMFCQDIAHDSSFRPARPVCIPAGQDQLRFRISFQIFPGRIESCQQVRRGFSFSKASPSTMA